MKSYSSSVHDVEPGSAARAQDESALRSMYETTPYPGPHKVKKRYLMKMFEPILPELDSRQNVRVLDVGCGTGANIVPLGIARPSWELCGIDLSAPSLELARQHASLNNVTVKFMQGSYLDEIPFDGQFDAIIATGTIHHCADPALAMKNIRGKMRDDGYMLFHMYGEYRDKVRFNIKEMLDILQPDRMDYKTRHEYFNALMQSRADLKRNRRLLTKIGNTTLADIYYWLMDKIKTPPFRKAPWGPVWSWMPGPGDERWNSWVDQFCNPCERGYTVPEIQELVESTGYRVERMLSQGARGTYPIPERWRAAYDRLDDWAKWRIDELMHYPDGIAFNMILRKA